MSEFLCTLQPVENSDLSRCLSVGRMACLQSGLGYDSTGLYPPHVTIIGFFKASGWQVECLSGLIHQRLASLWNCDIEVKEVVVTNKGHVLLDITAPAFADLAMNLAVDAAKLGLALRPKAANHLSLAEGRSAEECSCIAQQYIASLQSSTCRWEFVLSRLSYRSDLDQLRSGGSSHHFEDVLRLPVPMSKVGRGSFEEVRKLLELQQLVNPLHDQPLASSSTATPARSTARITRKRGGDELGSADPDLITPAKEAKALFASLPDTSNLLQVSRCT